MLTLYCWCRKKRGGDADVCKYMRIRHIFTWLRNKNQRSTELIEFAIGSFCKNSINENIEAQSV